MSFDQIAGEKIKLWREHPARFVREVFGVEPDAWQVDVLEQFPHVQRQAMKSCKGPGKTALLAWLGWNFLLTRAEPKIAATSISGENLADGLWAEMSKWQGRSDILQAGFEWTKTRIFAKERPETWFMAARNWSKSADKSQQSNTLAGFRADYVMFILDEAGGIPDSVMAAADAALGTGIEGHLLMAGNPTHLEGPLYRACTSERNLWSVTEVTGDPDDPKRSSRVKIEWAREQIQKYGRDNPWVLVNVFGRFPPASLNTLIGPDEVRDAMKRAYRSDDIAGMAKVLGVDTALFGDDANMIFPRQGLVAFEPIKLRGVKPREGAGAVARKWKDWGADACFIDNTGGYGASWIDNLQRLGRDPIGVGFATSPNDPRYANKRAEMYFEAIQWVKDGGALPDIPELLAALTQTTYSFRGDRLLLEDKDQIKQRLGYSPDDADAFVLTFAQPVEAAWTPVDTGLRAPAGTLQHDYDPLAEEQY